MGRPSNSITEPAGSSAAARKSCFRDSPTPFRLMCVMIPPGLPHDETSEGYCTRNQRLLLDERVGPHPGTEPQTAPVMPESLVSDGSHDHPAAVARDAGRRT